MKIVGRKTEFSEEKMRIIRAGKLDNSAGEEITNEDFKKEVNRLFKEEFEAIDNLIKMTS